MAADASWRSWDRRRISAISEKCPQVVEENQVVDAAVSDDRGVVVVRCITEVVPKVVVPVPLPLPVNSLGDEVEAVDELGDLTGLEDCAVDAVYPDLICGPGVPLSAWLANHPSTANT